MTSYVRFFASIGVDDAIALFADIAGRALVLGRPAAFVRERFAWKPDDNHSSRGTDATSWPGTATYAGDGASIAVDVTGEEGGNPYDGWGYSVSAVLTLPPPRGGRVTFSGSGSSFTCLPFRLEIDDDPDRALHDVVHALARARAGADAEDQSVRPKPL